MNSDQITKLAQELHTLEPGKLPLPVFLEIAQLTVTPIVEIVPFRQHQNVPEVLLIKRPSDDPTWPDLWHTPGTVLRASDEQGSLQSAFDRIIHDELKDPHVKDHPKFVTHIFHKVARGMELALVHWVLLEGPVETGRFFTVDSLPDDIVETQKGFILRALKDFQAK